MGPGCAGGGGPEYQRRNEGAAFKPVLIAGEPVRSGVDEMSLATKIAAGLCICPVVAAPPALVHKPTRDKIARAAGYVPKAQKPVRAPVSVNPEVACVRSDEQTSELQSLMRLSYAVFCLKQKNKTTHS